ncbi:EamA family transporter RarD, partial [Streptomyces sp. URMC 123]
AVRLPLSTMGLLQYLAPTFQFVLGVAVFHEAMPPERWAGFALVWLALALLTWDALRTARRARGALRAASAKAGASADRAGPTGAGAGAGTGVATTAASSAANPAAEAPGPAPRP